MHKLAPRKQTKQTGINVHGTLLSSQPTDHPHEQTPQGRPRSGTSTLAGPFRAGQTALLRPAPRTFPMTALPEEVGLEDCEGLRSAGPATGVSVPPRPGREGQQYVLPPTRSTSTSGTGT